MNNVGLARERVERDLTLALADLLHEEIVWAARPEIAHCSVEFEPRRQSIQSRLNRGGLLRAGSMNSFVKAKGRLFLWRSLNQRRSFGSLPDAGTTMSHVNVRSCIGLPRQRATLQALANEISRRTANSFPLSASLVHQLLVRVYANFGDAHRLFDRLRPRTLVVANQFRYDIRPYLLTARAAGIPTVYVPHAPFAANFLYADLPVDLATLRGEREVAGYLALGAAPDGMTVVGNAAISIDEAPSRPMEVILAPSPSPWDRSVEDRFFEFIRRATLPDAVICAHPGLDLNRLRRLAPPGVPILRGVRTAERIVRTGGIVVQYSSGVAGEALLAGAPVIQLCCTSEVPNYPLIAEPHVAFVDTAKGLTDAVEALMQVNPQQRAARIRWAREWCGATGHAAEKMLDAALDDVRLRPTPVLDTWAGGR